MRLLRALCRYRTDTLWSLLCASGLWRIRTEGGFYRDGYWQWAFWKDHRYRYECGRERFYGAAESWPFLGYLMWIRLELVSRPHPEPWYVARWRQLGMRVWS